jgi:hypothetical protein
LISQFSEPDEATEISRSVSGEAAAVWVTLPAIRRVRTNGAPRKAARLEPEFVVAEWEIIFRHEVDSWPFSRPRAPSRLTLLCVFESARNFCEFRDEEASECSGGVFAES